MFYPSPVGNFFTGTKFEPKPRIDTAIAANPITSVIVSLESLLIKLLLLPLNIGTPDDDEKDIGGKVNEVAAFVLVFE